MRLYQLIHQPTGQMVATVQRADNWWTKGWGLLGCQVLPLGEGLWLPQVASVHTMFVRFPLDLLFLDAEFRTIRLAPQTSPWQWVVRASGAHHTLELGAGTLGKLASCSHVGDRWELYL